MQRFTQKKFSITHAAFFTFLLFVLFTPQAHAYLDPNTGSYLLQIMAATIFGGLFALKTWWGEIKRYIQSTFFRKDTKNSEKHLTKDK